VKFEDATLGATVFPGAALDMAWEDQCNDLGRVLTD